MGSSLRPRSKELGRAQPLTKGPRFQWVHASRVSSCLKPCPPRKQLQETARGRAQPLLRHPYRTDFLPLGHASGLMLHPNSSRKQLQEAAVLGKATQDSVGPGSQGRCLTQTPPSLETAPGNRLGEDAAIAKTTPAGLTDFRLVARPGRDELNPGFYISRYIPVYLLMIYSVSSL